MRKVFILLAALGLASCGPMKADVIHDVEDYGFSEVEIGSWTAFYCGKDDVWGYHFTATNSQGRRITGVVCRGAFKGATVRILRGVS
jgi:hypothetical protein